MNSAYTISEVADLPWIVSSDTASGPWSVEALSKPQSARRAARGVLRPFGLGLVFAFSPLTAVTDPWVIERRRQTSPTAYVRIEATGRRQISLREARELALRLMAETEAARSLAAEDEARRSLSLEDIA